MASLGELIIELGVVGDIKPLQDTLDKMKKAEKQSARLLKYLQDLKNAQTDAERKLIKQNFARSISIKKTEEEIDRMKKLAGNIAGVVKGLTAFVTATAGVIYAIDRMTDALFQQNQAWINLTRQSDISLKTFQKYAGVASILDKSLGMEGAAGSIADLEQRLFRLELLGEGAEGFLLAGINPMGKNANQVLEDIRNRIRGLSDKKATFLLKQMGIDPKMLAMLRLTREEFNSLNAEIERYQLNFSQRKEIQNYQEEVAKIKMQLQYLKDRALLAILPAFSKFLKSVERVAEFFARLGKRVGEFIVKFRGIIALLAIFATKLAPVQAFFKAIKGIGIALEKIPFLGKFITGFVGGISRALLPLMALWLIIDDIMTYMQGGDSYTGDLIEWFNSIGENFQKVFEAIQKNFGDGMKKLFVWIWSVVDDIVGVLAGFLQFLTFGTVPFTEWLNKARHSGTMGAYYDDIKAGNYDRLFANPSVSNQTNNNNDNRQVNLNANIYTSETANELQNMCTYANAYFSPLPG